MFEHQVKGIIYSKWVHRLSLRRTSLAECRPCWSTAMTSARVPAGCRRSAGWRHRHRLLLEAGHRRIAFVNDAAPSPASVGRIAGYKAALAQFDVDFDPSLVLSVTADQEGGYGAGRQVLATGATGVFCHNDRTALGLYDALRESGKAYRTIFPWSLSTTRK